MFKGNTDLCVRNDFVCPITSLTTGASTDLEKIQIQDAYLKINRNINEIPLIDLKVSINAEPCLDPNTSPKIKRYPSYNEPNNGCDEFGTISAWSSLIREEGQDVFFKLVVLKIIDFFGFCRENMEELFTLNLFSNFMDLTQKAKLYSIARISSKNEHACSTYNKEALEKLDASVSSLSKTFWISACALVFCLISSILLFYYFIQHEKDTIVNNI